MHDVYPVDAAALIKSERYSNVVDARKRISHSQVPMEEEREGEDPLLTNKTLQTQRRRARARAPLGNCPRRRVSVACAGIT